MFYLENTTDPQIQLVLFIIFGCCLIPIIGLVLFAFVKMMIKQRKKMHKKPVTKLAYVDYFGGADNILQMSKNLSRVTVEVKDLELVQLDDLKAMGVGVMITGNVVKCSSQSFADQVKL